MHLKIGILLAIGFPGWTIYTLNWAIDHHNLYVGIYAFLGYWGLASYLIASGMINKR